MIKTLFTQNLSWIDHIYISYIPKFIVLEKTWSYVIITQYILINFNMIVTYFLSCVFRSNGKILNSILMDMKLVLLVKNI